MVRTDALSINIDANTADKLAEIQRFVIGVIQKGAVSEKMSSDMVGGVKNPNRVCLEKK